MSVTNVHPLYAEFSPLWTQLRDSHVGERRVKSRGGVYLPPTSGMRADGYPRVGTDGWNDYRAYVTRAVFPDFVRDAVRAALGVMHAKPPTIDLPPRLERLRERATLRNESLEMLLRRINEEQLVTGRIGLLAEVPEKVDESLPYVATYAAESIRNWDEGDRVGLELERLNLVILDESGPQRQEDFTWQVKQQYRVLVLGDVLANEASGPYRQGVFTEDDGLDFSESSLMEPKLRGRRLAQIPFAFVNVADVVPDPDEPPMLGLSQAAMAVYRGEADYRQSLFMQGQDTLVLIGSVDDASVRTGAGAVIHLPIGGDGKYVGVDSSGLPEQRAALENDYRRAGGKAGELIDETSRERESGDALRVRVSARTASLRQIAITGAFGLQDILRKIAEWVGDDPELVVVEPNLDFSDDGLTGDELVKLVTAKSLGAPLALETIHRVMQERGLTESTWKEELELIRAEAALADLLGGERGSTARNGPEDDPELEGSAGGSEVEPPEGGA